MAALVSHAAGASEPMAPRPGGDHSLVVGPGRLGWIYGKSRKWGARMLRMWAEEQANGGPVRVFIAPGGALSTTMAIVHQYMPPGRDLALYRRVEVVERDVADAHSRIDRAVTQIGAIDRRLGRVESARAKRSA